jgi:quercetin dioxygenase-like cupin family protein
MLALVLSVLFGGTVFATASSGFHGTILSRGTISERVHAHTSAVTLKTKKSVDVVTATVTFDALGSSGWHAHPGVVLVTVVSGSLVVYDEDCEATVQAAGSAFVESGDDAGLVRNESATTPAVVNVTYIVPAGTPNSGLRIDKANPGCPKS